MKYKIYFNGTSCTLYDASSTKCLANMRDKVVRSCSVEFGGKIDLPNGDVLCINEAYGSLDDFGYEGSYGLGVYLESGNNLQAFYISPEDNRGFSSMWGIFYDLDDAGFSFTYSDGMILKIFDLGDEDWYDYAEGWKELEFSQFPCYTLIIVDQYKHGYLYDMKWYLVDDTKYTGNTVRLSSGEEIFVSGLSFVDYGEIGVWFTRSSGNMCFAFYLRDGDVIHETSNFWFGETYMPEEDDVLEIYEFDWDVYDEYDFSYQTISESCENVCKLIFGGNKWRDANSTQCSVENGGTIALFSGDTLQINEKMGRVSPFLSDSNNYYGIGLALESGLKFFAFIHLQQPFYEHYIIETGYGCFYSVDEEILYENGNSISIYIFSEGEDYSDYSDVYRRPVENMENYIVSHYGISPIEIRIDGDNWILD